LFEIARAIIAQISAVVNRNLLLVRYSFERLAKSFKRGELKRRWGEKVTIGEDAEQVRGLVAAKGDSKPAHAKPAYAALGVAKSKPARLKGTSMRHRL